MRGYPEVRCLGFRAKFSLGADREFRNLGVRGRVAGVGGYPEVRDLGVRAKFCLVGDREVRELGVRGRVA